MSYESILKMMEEYAYSEKEKAYSYFINKYNLPNPYSFYKARDLAIVCHIVDEKTCFRIRDKASSNKQESGSASLRHFDELMERRKRFLELAFSRYEIQDIAYKYADGNTVESISKVYEICKGSVKILLAKGVMENIIPSPVVISIKDRLIREGKDLSVFEKKLEKGRMIKRKEALEPLKQEAKLLKYQILSYEDYFFEDENVPTLDFLKNRLQEVEEKISNLG